MPAYNKLVRNRIPEIIKNDGKTPKTRILNGEEYRFELLKKIVEEAQEVAAAPDKNELAKELGDVLEVVDAIIEANGLGRRMKLLDQATADMPEPPYVDECFEGFAALAETLWGIGTVLSIIGETPNAYINPEAMEALRSPVEFAASIDEQEWAKELLKADSLLAS